MLVVKVDWVLTDSKTEKHIAYVMDSWHYVEQIGYTETGFQGEWYWRAFGVAPTPDKIVVGESSPNYVDYVIIPESAL